jgi:hypothetical protein
MILEFRALLSAVVVTIVTVALLFFQWQFVFPVFGLLYLAYKYVYYRRRIDPAKTGPNAGDAPGSLLGPTVLLFVGLFVITRVAIFPLFGSVWTAQALSPPIFNLRNAGVLINQLVGLVAVWAAVLVPAFVISYAVGQFRARLLGGVDSEAAAARATLWEGMARLPVYYLWAAIFLVGPVYGVWGVVPQTVMQPLGLSIPAPNGIAPVLSDVFFVVVVAGHLIPALVAGTYILVSREKYGNRTVPEVLGYRGLYAPDRHTSPSNFIVPGAAFLLYAVAVIVYGPGGSLVRPALVLPVLVSIFVAADVRGVTGRFMRALPSGVPGSGADAVVFGLYLGLAVLGLLAVPDALGVGLGANPTALMYYPILGAPLSFVGNTGLALVKAKQASNLADRVDEEPNSLTEAEVDRLLGYAEARSERLRAAAIAGLASAVRTASYRESEAMTVFESALERDDEALLRPGLDGVVNLLRADRDSATTDRLLEMDVLDPVVEGMDGTNAETAARATEAFCRLVTGSYGIGQIMTVLAEVDALPVERVEAAVTGEAANQQLTDAAIEGFAVFWYERDHALRDFLGPDERRSVLTDLVWWSGFASEVPRGKAAFALASDPAITDEAGLDEARGSLDNNVPLTRFMAAHVVRSSTARHADRLAAADLLALLNDEYDLVRWAGADAIQEYVRATGDSERVVTALLDHLDAQHPDRAGAAEATVLSTLELVEESAVADREGAAATVAAYLSSENGAVAEPAARLLATFVDADPESGQADPVLSALESGLTHENGAAREHCVRAVASVVESDEGAGRPFVRGLVLNLGSSGTVSEIAASALRQVLAEYPEYGTEYLPEMAGGLRNPTSIARQYAGAMVVGRTVSQVTASLLAEITEYDTSGGDVLVDPLVDLAGNTGGVVRESVFATLANLSRDFPDEARSALPAAQAALDAGDVRVRRNAAHVLSNVALENPEAVAPMAASLIVAVDDADPQMRSVALVTLGTVGAEAPDAIEADIRRIIGRLDDDSSLVREHAAKAIVTVARRQPDVVEPAAEAADRLRRIERDPAVDLEEGLLHEAANAIRTGTPPGEDAEDADEGIVTTESADEAGESSDTRVFEPMDDDAPADPPDADSGDFPEQPPDPGDSDLPTEPPAPDDSEFPTEPPDSEESDPGADDGE